MLKPKAVLFDLGGTLIKQSSGDFLKGTKALLEHSILPKILTAEMIQTYAYEISRELSESKDKTHLENSCQTFQKYLFESFNITINLSPLEQEILFNRTTFDRELMPGLMSFLELLKKEQIRVGVLSNTTFTEATLRDELSIYNLETSFEFIIATADYGFRKPDPRIFNLALTKFGLKGDAVWYIGNSFKYDVIGANNSGLYPIWINHEQKMPLKDIPYKEVENYFTLTKVLKEIL